MSLPRITNRLPRAHQVGNRHYNIGYAVISLIFVSNAFGFIAAAPFVDAIRLRLGRAKAGCLANILMAVGFVPLVLAAPFPAVVVGYFFIGWGVAITLAMSNVCISSHKVNPIRVVIRQPPPPPSLNKYIDSCLPRYLRPIYKTAPYY